MNRTTNPTTVTDFFLFGFLELKNVRFVLFGVFLIVHILTLTGNVLIITLVRTCPSLHSPMYFFLCHLAFCDLLFTSDIVPNMLYVIWEEGGTISFSGCLTQFQIFGSATSTECLLLAVMSYDRYLAICKPLHYYLIMNGWLQYNLVLLSWLLGFIMTLCITIQISFLEFCGAKHIDHYFCDFDPLLELSCSDTSFIRTQVNTSSCFLVVPPFILIIITYFYIFFTIRKIPFTSSRWKTFYTCSSHLTVVCGYYGSLISIYLASSGSHLLNVNKFLSLLNIVGTPLLNPIIYSLRNVDIRMAAWRLVNIFKTSRPSAPKEPTKKY